MDRIPSSHALLSRTPDPHIDNSATLPMLPEEVIRNIVGKIDKADNETLAHLVQTSKDMARIVGADALLSFFYAARSAYDAGNSSKKVAVFCHLAGWIRDVADQLPEASVNQIFEHLSHMSRVDIDDVRDAQRMLESIAKLTLTVTAALLFQLQMARTSGNIDFASTQALEFSLNRLAFNYGLFAESITTELQKNESLFFRGI